MEAYENDTLDESQSTEGENEAEVIVEESTPEESKPTENITDADTKTGDNYYSPEEFNELIKKGAVFMDSSRVSPAHKHYFDAILEREKSMQADYTRKTQELAQARKSLEAQKMSPEERFYYEYAQNPLKVRNEANAAIVALEQQEVEAMEEMNYQQVRELRNQKARIQKVLNDAEIMYASNRQLYEHAANIDRTFQAEILKDFPDFFSGKQEALSSYLASEGVDMRVQALMANPVILDNLLKSYGINDINGITASRQIIKAINAAYERANAVKTADKKEVKKPPLTGKTGIGETSADASIKSLKERAIKEGDISSWANYLLAKEGKT